MTALLIFIALVLTMGLIGLWLWWRRRNLTV